MESPPPRFVINQVEDDDQDVNGNLTDLRSRVNSFTLRPEYDDNCGQCKKLAQRKTTKCRHCRSKCQRQCSRNHSFKLKTGDEHWSKYLQASEDHAHFLLNGSDGKLSIQHACTCNRGNSSGSMKNTTSNIFSSLYSRLTEWVATRRSVGTSSNKTRTKCSKHRKAAQDQSKDFVGDFMNRQVRSVNGLSPSDCSYNEFQTCHSPVSSNCSEYDHLQFISSTCSSYSVISTPSYSGMRTPNRSCNSQSVHSPTHVAVNETNSANEFAKHYPDFVLKLLEWSINSQDNVANKHDTTILSHEDARCLNSRQSHPIQRRSKRRQSTHSRKLERHKSAPLWRTWPTIENTEISDPTEMKQLDATGAAAGYDVTSQSTNRNQVSRLNSQMRTDSQQSEADRRDPLTEFSIIYGDLQLAECIRKGNTRNIYRGKWHGDVLVHSYHHLNEDERCNFWKTVSQLGKIRHENVVLYMGACLEEPNFAIVTSIRKGISLYEHIHMRSENTSVFSSLHIARQIAQAMGYLHARGVVVEKLCSRNVSLEPKVKLCLMDHSFTETQHNREHLVSLPRGNLSYMAPELLKSTRVDKNSLVMRQPHTEMSDVYAFGTLLYEMSTEKFPLHGMSPECVIYQVCSGKRACLRHVNIKQVVKGLIKRCWSHEPLKRPEFEEINESLQQHGSIHKKHSSSDPERLHRIGTYGRDRLSLLKF